MTQKRQTDRTSSRIRCEFLERKRSESHTVNVSRNGCFVTDPTERNINSLIRLKFFLPPNNSEMEVVGRVAWKGARENKPGYGIHFLKLETSDRQKWIEFVGQVEMLDASSSFRPEELIQPKVEEERRAQARTQSSFMVRFRNRERLEQFVAQNISEGGMFLKTPALRPVGDRVQVVLVHPETNKDFEIEAEVAHLNEEDTPESPKGMGLKFVSLSEEAKDALQIFLSETK